MKILTNFDQNLFDLLGDAHKWEYTQINDSKSNREKRKPMFFFTPFQWILFLLSVGCSIMCKKGITADFAGYIISGMSLFVGLLFTLAVSLFDKFNNVDFGQYKESVNLELYPFGVRLKNYFKKTIILTLYISLIAIVCIIMLSVIYLSESLQKTIDFYSFIQAPFKEGWVSFFKVIFIFVYRVILFYFLFNFLYITKQMITSFYDYMVSEIDKIKLK